MRVSAWKDDVSRKWARWALGLLVFFSGCTTAKRGSHSGSDPYIEMAESLQHEGLGDLPRVTQQREEDAYALNGRELDLYELLDVALRRNPSTRIAWHQMCAASAAKKKADSAFYPSVDVGLKGIRTEQLGNAVVDENKKVRMKTNLSTVLSPEVGVYYSLFKFGAHKEASHAALRNLEAAHFQFSQAIQDAVFYVALAYFGLDSALATVEANQQNLEDAKVALDVARNRHESGLASKQDLLKAQAAYSAAVFDLESSQSAVASAQAKLALSLGVYVSSNLKITRVTSVVAPPVDEIEATLTQALGARQDLRALEKKLEAKRHQLKAKERDYYPELITGLTASRQKIRHISGMYNNFSAYVGVQWNIFDGFSRTAERLMAREEMRIAEMELRAKELDITSQVWEHFYALKSAVQKLEAAKESENCAQEAFNYTREAYQNGLCSFTDLLTSQSALSLARRQLVCAKNDLSIEWVQLAHASGQALKKDDIYEKI
ncbi:MAG: TolC family protein [Verrucomicrobiota bacterium]|nr:MAG: TolC family protein [Verrucomicrobiota bacterium]